MSTFIHKQVTLRALTNALGDDLYRAQSAFRDCTQAQMDEEYGASGKTRRQILEEIKTKHNEIQAAIDWVKSL